MVTSRNHKPAQTRRTGSNLFLACWQLLVMIHESESSPISSKFQPKETVERKNIKTYCWWFIHGLAVGQLVAKRGFTSVLEPGSREVERGFGDKFEKWHQKVNDQPEQKKLADKIMDRQICTSRLCHGQWRIGEDTQKGNVARTKWANGIRITWQSRTNRRGVKEKTGRKNLRMHSNSGWVRSQPNATRNRPTPAVDFHP